MTTKQWTAIQAYLKDKAVTTTDGWLSIYPEAFNLIQSPTYIEIGAKAKNADVLLFPTVMEITTDSINCIIQKAELGKTMRATIPYKNIKKIKILNYNTEK